MRRTRSVLYQLLIPCCVYYGTQQHDKQEVLQLFLPPMADLADRHLQCDQASGSLVLTSLLSACQPNPVGRKSRLEECA